MTAREVKAMGFRFIGSPVCDINTNPQNPIINIRSYGETRERVSEMAVAYLQGVQGEGVCACLKHFPGHGDTDEDSHRTLPRLPHDMERMEGVELAPFAAGIAAGAKCVMTSHIIFAALDPEHHRREAQERYRAVQEESRRSQADLKEFDERLQTLAESLGSQQAGYDFEDWFHELMDFFEVMNRRPYVSKGRQIDGSITVLVFGRVKGGFTVDLSGAVAFLPGSQVDIRPVRDIGPLMGSPQPFQVLKMDRARGNIVGSRVRRGVREGRGAVLPGRASARSRPVS